MGSGGFGSLERAVQARLAARSCLVIVASLGSLAGVSAADGNDTFDTAEGASLLQSPILDMGAGDDVVVLNQLVNLVNARIEMGTGNDELVVYGGHEAFIDMGPGDDVVSMIRFTGTYELWTGGGNDSVEMDGFAGGSLALDTGDGSDQVRILGEREVWDATEIEPLTIALGSGDDRLEIGRAAIGAASFDGGGGRDEYLDLGGIDFVNGPPELRSFELPKGSSGRAVQLGTRITGRVVAERGVPVPAAAVYCPELDLLTRTGADGGFLFDAVEDERRALQIVVGASVRGRPRSGATFVELLPDETSAAGDIVLEHGLRNVLVYGFAPDWDANRIDALEDRLLSLGFRRAELTHLRRLPADLSPYAVVWHMGSALPITARQPLVDFVRKGRGLYLSGGSATSASLEAIADQLVTSGVDIGFRTSGYCLFNPDAAGNVTRTPNALSDLVGGSFHLAIQGLEPRNVLLSSPSSGDVPGAVWDPADIVGGRGRLVLMVDSCWISAGSSPSLVENLQAFLQREPDGLTAR